MAILVLSALGATSTIDWLVAISVYARPIGLASVMATVLLTTRNVEPVRTTASSWIFSCLYLIVAIGAVSMIWSQDSLDTLLTVLMLFALVFSVQRLSERRWQNWQAMFGDIQLMLAITTIFLAAGILAEFLGVLPETFSGRFQGYLSNPNMASQVAALSLAIGWGVWRENGHPLRLLWLLPSLLTIFLSQSRTALLGVAIALLWLIIRSGLRGLMCALVFSAIAVGVVSAFGTGFLLPIIERFGSESGGDQYSGRSAIWMDAIDLIRENPLGLGLGSARFVAESTGQYSSFHNGYLQLAIEGGVIALALILAIYIVLFRVLIGTRGDGVSEGLSALVVVGFVSNFAESGIFGVGQLYPYLYWFGVGALLAVYAQAGRSESSSGVRYRRLSTQTRSSKSRA